MPSEERPLTRAQRREQGAEGGLWTVVLSLVLSTVVGTVIGWFLLSPGSSSNRSARVSLEETWPKPTPKTQAPDQREQLLSRLKALQVDRLWFLQLVDRSLNRRFPDRDGRLPSGAPEDQALQKVWIDLANDWLARIERLPPALRSRLGQLQDQDWSQQAQDLKEQGIPSRVVEHLISSGSRSLLPGEPRSGQPAEPLRQLWIAAAIESLADLKVERVAAETSETVNRSLRIPASGVRLVTISAPTDHRLELGVRGTPLMQMAVFGAEGQPVEQRGPMRVVALDATVGSPLHLIVTNNGVASSLATLSCRAERVEPSTVILEEQPTTAEDSSDDLDFDPMD